MLTLLGFYFITLLLLFCPKLCVLPTQRQLKTKSQKFFNYRNISNTKYRHRSPLFTWFQLPPLSSKGATRSPLRPLSPRSSPSHLFFFSRLFQLQHSAEQENPEELPAGLQERRRPRLHHVPACHHELPGRGTARMFLNLIGPASSPRESSALISLAPNSISCSSRCFVYYAQGGVHLCLFSED